MFRGVEPVGRTSIWVATRLRRFVGCRSTSALIGGSKYLMDAGVLGYTTPGSWDAASSRQAVARLAAEILSINKKPYAAAGTSPGSGGPFGADLVTGR